MGPPPAAPESILPLEVLSSTVFPGSRQAGVRGVLKVITEAVAALAAAGGTAVVGAAGTDAWAGFKEQVARLLGRGDPIRERAELERLDETAHALESATPQDAELIRIRQESSWQTRFEIMLDNLSEFEQTQMCNLLRKLIAATPVGPGGVSAALGGVASAGDIINRAEGGSIAATVIEGGAQIGSPPPPNP